jgi:hypothetical protein
MLPLERVRSIIDGNYKGVFDVTPGERKINRRAIISGCSMFDRARVRSNTQHFLKSHPNGYKTNIFVLQTLGPNFIHVLFY